MMGRLKGEQAQLFYQFELDDAVPEDHLVRKIDAAVEKLPLFAASRHSFPRRPMTEFSSQQRQRVWSRWYCQKIYSLLPDE